MDPVDIQPQDPPPDPSLGQSPSENKAPDNNAAPQQTAPVETPPNDVGSPPNEETEKPKRDEDRKALADKVADIRKKENPSDEEKQIVAEFEATKRKPGRKPKWWHEQRARGIENPTDPNAEGAPSESKPPVNRNPKPPTVELGKTRNAPPPVFHTDDGWKAKYKTGHENGRELVCHLLGSQWGTMLDNMQKQLSDAGVDPLIDTSTPEFKNMLVLAVDEILPPRITATPAVIGAFATTSTISQRFLHRKRIADHQSKTKTNRMTLVQTMKDPKTTVNQLVDSSGLRSSPDVKRAPDGKTPSSETPSKSG